MPICIQNDLPVKNTLTGNVLPVLMNGKQVHQNLIRIFKIIQKSVLYVSLEKCS